jgi:leader peptidase (prepilin peptidase)/N-methyltransferase
MLRSFAFLFGALWGSFFNVAIYRWPREMSVVTPPSHCPACGAPVPAFRNVPILGYLWLRGRAACCGARMSPRYVVVEALAGVLLLALVERFCLAVEPNTELLPALGESLLYFVFVGGLLIATFVDLEHMEIPDEVTLPCAALGLATAGMRAEPGVEAAALGAGGGFLAVQLLFVWGYERLSGRRGMGEGDSKLLLMIGAFLGWRGAVFAIVAGAFQGILATVISLATGTQIAPDVDWDDEDDLEEGDPKDSEADPEEADSEGQGGDPGDRESEPGGFAPALKVPFGPFLALGALEYQFFGERVIELYLSLFGG